MRLEELHSRIGKIIAKNPDYKFRPVLYWQGKRKSDGEDTFGQPFEIIPCTVNMAPDSTLTGCQKCIVLSPIVNFQEFKMEERK